MPPTGCVACGWRHWRTPKAPRSPTPSRPWRASCERERRMIGKYRGNRQAISALVRETEVHRDLYLDQELFELEMEHLFANTWIYVGHEGQVAETGDYYATSIGTQPVIMVPATDGAVPRVYHPLPP